MPRVSKIQQFHLEETISSMANKEGLNGIAIAERLVAMGYKISHPAVCRWLAAEREKTRTQSEKIFSEHIAEQLPKDLDALEAMEALCLEWANETGADRVQRISSWIKVSELVPSYAEKLSEFSSMEPKERSGLVSRFIRELMGILVEDVNLVKQRLAAISQGTKIIETKLKNAGLIADTEKGNIVVKAYDQDSATPDPDPSRTSYSDRRVISFQGGKR